jgi:hypothetical protein
MMLAEAQKFREDVHTDFAATIFHVLKAPNLAMEVKGALAAFTKSKNQICEEAFLLLLALIEQKQPELNPLVQEIKKFLMQLFPKHTQLLVKLYNL